jgi:type VI secretion system secreted protein VgrG
MPRQSDLRFTFTPLKGDPFDVVSFTLEESLSQPFKLTLELASHNAAIDFNRVLDLAGLFTIWRGETAVRYVHGLVSLFTQGDTGFRRTRYSAVIEPTLSRFDLRSNWRIFQAQTVPDIITSVLAEQKLTDIRREICFEHQPHEYCVQAGETDLDFIARLAAEEGLLYTFEHRADGHTLVLIDRVGGLGTIGTHKDCPVLYQPMAGGDSMEPALTRFHYTEQVRTARQVQRDYTFTHPRYNQQHTATGDQDLNNQHKDYERYDYPGRHKRDIAGKPFTKTRLPSCATTPSWPISKATMNACNRGWRSTSTITPVRISTTAGGPSPCGIRANSTAASKRNRSAATEARLMKCTPARSAGLPTGKRRYATNPASTARRSPPWSARRAKRSIAMNGAG